MADVELPEDLLTELRSVALAAATAAAEVVRHYAGTVLTEVSTKSSPTDLVSEADRASERLIADHIRRHRPDDSLHGEEGTSHTGSSGISWVADPLDGTTNFFFGLPAYGVSVAATFGGQPVAGVVVDCCRDETWSSARGQGAWCNDRPCQAAAGRSELATALVATGFSYQAERRAVQAAVVSELITQVRDVRRFGSAALDLCWVAAGRYDAYFESGLNEWDWAAGRLICEEAGARVDMLPGGELLAATPQLFAPIADLINTAHSHRRPGQTA